MSTWFCLQKSGMTATSTCSITSGNPGPHATTAARRPSNFIADECETTSSRELRWDGFLPWQVMTARGEEDVAMTAIQTDSPLSWMRPVAHLGDAGKVDTNEHPDDGYNIV
jgi:hypothetical protein